jgi:hypothetical protein
MSDNPLDESDTLQQQRIRERAYHLWEADGRPQGRDLEYWERARELVGMEQSAGAGLMPNPMTHQTNLNGLPEGVDEAEVQDNYGEFPDRFADQGEWQATPKGKQGKKGKRKAAEKDPRAGAPKPAGSS